jgi:hypothetical protein
MIEISPERVMDAQEVVSDKPSNTGSMIEISPERIQGSVSEEKELSFGQQMYKKIRPYAESTAIGLGTAGGGIVGFGSPIPGGTAIGGMLGYAAGEELIDALDKVFGIEKGGSLSEEAWEAINNLEEGALWEMVGPVLGFTGKAFSETIKKTGVIDALKKTKELFPSLSDKGRLLKAREILKDMQGKTLEEQTTARKTDALFERLGIKRKPTPGQRTGAPQAVSFEQMQTSKKPEVKAVLDASDQEILTQGTESINRQFSGKEGIGTLKDIIGSKVSTLESEAKTRGKNIEDIVGSIKAKEQRGIDIGDEIYQKVKVSEKETKKIHENLYNSIKDTDVKSSPLVDSLKNTIGDFEKSGGGAESMPTSIIEQINVGLKGAKPSKQLYDAKGNLIKPKTKYQETIKVDKLRDWDKQINKEITDNINGPKPNRQLVRRLYMLKQGINDTMDQLLTLGENKAEIKRLYTEAKSAFTEYSGKFREGPVNEILQKKFGGIDGLKVLKSDMPAMFYKPKKVELADALINAIGKQEAKSVIKPYAETLFLSKATKNGVLNSNQAKTWLENNEQLLKTYGLYDDFAKIAEQGKTSESAVSNLAEYQTAIVSNILKSDANKVIKTLFSGVGKKESQKTMQDLLNIPEIKGNPAAINGIQNSFKNFLVKELEKKKGDPVELVKESRKLYEEFSPAMKVLYKNSPEKMRAFYDYHRLVSTVARNKKISTAKLPKIYEKVFKKEQPAWQTVAESAGTLAAVMRGVGWFWSATKNLAKVIITTPGKASAQEIDNILTQALVDPSYAEIAMKSIRGMATESMKKELKYLKTTGKVISAKEAIEQLTGRNVEPVQTSEQYLRNLAQ